MGRQGDHYTRITVTDPSFPPLRRWVVPVTVRAITRDATTPSARELARLGAEVVAAPLVVGATAELARAFAGADGAFLWTPPIAPPDTHEFALGVVQVEAARTAGVGHVVFSSLPNVDAITAGKKFAPHFTDKARIAAHLRDTALRSTIIELAFFYTNLFEIYLPYREGDTLVFPIYLPEDFRAPFVDAATATGPAVLSVMDDPARYTGATLAVVGDVISPREMVAAYQRVTGQAAAYRSAYTREELLAAFPGFAANELLVREIVGMVEYAVEYGYFPPDRDLTWSRRNDPGTITWEAFVRGRHQ